LISDFIETFPLRQANVASRICIEQTRGGSARRGRLLVQFYSAAIGFTALVFLVISAPAAHWLSNSATPSPGGWKVAGRSRRHFLKMSDFRRTSDGLEIAGWFIPSEGSCRALVLIHGKDSNRTREFDKDLSDIYQGIPGPCGRAQQKSFFGPDDSISGVTGRAGQPASGSDEPSGSTCAARWIGS